MDQAAFTAKYPNVTFSVDPKVSGNPEFTPEVLEHARANIRSLFEDIVPEHTRTILNQLGTRVHLVDGHNNSGVDTKATNFFLDSFGTVKDSPQPQLLELDARGFSGFNYKPGKPFDDTQRYCEMAMAEEPTHAVMQRLVMHPQWVRNFVLGNMTETHHFGPLHNAMRDYYSPGMEKATLYGYGQDKKYGWLKVAHEVPPDIEHFRHFLRAARDHGGKNLYGRPEVEGALMQYHGRLAGVPEEQVTQAIDGILLEAMPRTYPMYRTFEDRLMKVAAGIKAYPEHFPVISRLNSLEQLKVAFSRDNAWKQAFKDFGRGLG